MHLFNLIFLIISFFLSISVILFSLYSGISPMPSSRKAKVAILSKIPLKSQIIFEMGSGWGGLALAIGKKFPEAKVIAYEISFLPWLVSLAARTLFRIKNVHFFRKNFFYISLKEADVVVCYLYPKGMKRLKEKFQNELKKPVTVISNSFSIPDWTFQEEIEVQDLWRSKIFVYKK